MDSPSTRIPRINLTDFGLPPIRQMHGIQRANAMKSLRMEAKEFVYHAVFRESFGRQGQKVSVMRRRMSVKDILNFLGDKLEAFYG